MRRWSNIQRPALAAWVVIALFKSREQGIIGKAHWDPLIATKSRIDNAENEG